MAINFEVISGIINDQGSWCKVAIFIFLLFTIDFILHMFRIEECKRLKKQVKKFKEIFKNGSTNKTSKEV